MLDTLEPKKVQINFQTTPEMKAEMEHQAWLAKMTLSEYLRKCHEYYMDAMEAKRQNENS